VRRLKALASVDDARDACAINDAISMAADERAEWQAVEDLRELEAQRELARDVAAGQVHAP
jgi:hypothetical protein